MAILAHLATALHEHANVATACYSVALLDDVVDAGVENSPSNLTSSESAAEDGSHRASLLLAVSASGSFVRVSTTVAENATDAFHLDKLEAEHSPGGMFVGAGVIVELAASFSEAESCGHLQNWGLGQKIPTFGAIGVCSRPGLELTGVYPPHPVAGW